MSAPAIETPYKFDRARLDHFRNIVASGAQFSPAETQEAVAIIETLLGHKRTNRAEIAALTAEVARLETLLAERRASARAEIAELRADKEYLTNNRDQWRATAGELEAQVAELRNDLAAARDDVVYKRTISGKMVRKLIMVWAVGGTREYVHVPTVTGDNDGEFAKLRYWGLAEEGSDERADGGHKGKWRCTERGLSWLRGELAVPKFSFTLAGTLIRQEGPNEYVYDVRSRKFDLRQLLRDSRLIV